MIALRRVVIDGHRQPLGRWACALRVMLLAAWVHAPAQAACVDEDRYDSARAAAEPAADVPVPTEPRTQLQAMVRDALALNNGIGAARLLNEAALSEIEEARAAMRPQASLLASVSPGLVATGNTSNAQVQARAGFGVGQVVYDGGRGDRLVDWRKQLAEVARLGILSTREQISLSTSSLAFERSRFRMQAAIYAQEVRKMSCLVQSLETIVGADKGRNSELVQARKQLQLAEVQQVQATSQARQVEAKLRRMVGDGLPGTQGFGSLLLKVPDLPEVLASAARSADILQLDANAASMKELARVVEAGAKPVVSWAVAGSAMAAAGAGSPRNTGLNAGITVNVPLLNPAVEHSIQAARKRAEAAALQRADALETRRQQIVQVHEQAGAAFERVRRVGLVLRDSDLLRNYTLQQWQKLGRRSLFDVIAAETDHYNLRVQYINALHDGQQMNAMLLSLGSGLAQWLQ